MRISEDLQHVQYGEAPAGYFSRALYALLEDASIFEIPNPDRNWFGSRRLNEVAYLVLARAQMHLPTHSEVWSETFDTLAHARHQIDTQSIGG